MENTMGPEFDAIIGLSSLVLLEGNQKREVMGIVRDGIVDGTRKVVSELALEEKYQRAAVNALKDGMRHVEYAFEMFMEGIDTGASTTPAIIEDWQPEPFAEAVCCMKGMDCWTGKFANAAGRAQLIADIERF